MKRSAGFTLIELVIVIIILGILAVTAAPKFINLQSDARESTLSGLKAAMESASSLVYSKAVINGVESTESATVSINNKDVATVYGYPAATSTALSNVLDLSDNDWDWGTSGDVVYAYPDGVSGAVDSCSVTYEAPSASGSRPTITVQTGC
ncbi:prepilin-type N-terminal cleavage/methylation domain-containing protein [Pseudaeromonas sp. ZJS20]|uniref:prepilin-type N-terminal cleavage/methylation domain-containing protein n=1 Tax=Pseudaeromonas aegiceratis TaxID=3153928 RepID=UPI00390CA505